MIKKDLARLEKKVDAIIELLQAPGGVIVRVDRLEQNEKRRAWWVRTAVGAWVTTVTAFIAAKLGFTS